MLISSPSPAERADGSERAREGVGRQVLLPYAARGGRGGGEDGGKERWPGEGGKLAKRGEKSRIGERSVGSSRLHTYYKFPSTNSTSEHIRINYESQHIA